MKDSIMFGAIVQILFTCLPVFAQPCEKGATKPDIAISDEMRPQLEAIHREYLLEASKLEGKSVEVSNGREFVTIRIKTKGETVVVNGKPYPIKAVLGRGLSAVVYLVDSGGKPAVAKVFHQGFLAEWGLFVNLSQLEKRTTVEILEMDQKNETLLLEYAEGLPIALFLGQNDYWEKKSNLFGVTPEMKGYFRTAYSELPAKKRYDWTHNQILTFSGYLTIVDAH